MRLPAGDSPQPRRRAGSLQPRGQKIFFGTSDTGNSADFGQFSVALHKHPALIESFRTWGSDFPDSIKRWQAARARPVLHITTADSGDGHEIITPRAIAQGLRRRVPDPPQQAVLGEEDARLRAPAGRAQPLHQRLRVLRLRRQPARFRPQAVLVPAGLPPDLHPAPRRRQAGERSTRRLAEAGLPPLSPEVVGLPRAPVAVIWSTLPAGSPTVPRNRPKYFYPGDEYVDWVGTDFYSDNQDWKSLTGLYNRFSTKPFAIPEFGVSSGDDPRYMQHLMTWVKRHDRCKMLVYYQDFGSSSPYRIQNYPASLAVLDKQIHSKRFPAFAPGHPDAAAEAAAADRWGRRPPRPWARARPGCSAVMLE